MAVLDIASGPVIDTAVARHLLETMTAAWLLAYDAELGRADLHAN